MIDEINLTDIFFCFLNIDRISHPNYHNHKTIRPASIPIELRDIENQSRPILKVNNHISLYANYDTCQEAISV